MQLILTRSIAAAATLPRTRRATQQLFQHTRVRVVAWWLASFAVLTFYALLRGQADNAGMPRHGAEIETTFFRALPTVWLQNNVFERAPGTLEWASVVVHSSWFFLPPMAALLVTIRRPTRVGSFFRWWIALELLALPLFMLFPTRPPWMESDEVTRVIALRFGGEIEDPNPLAAMPSLHVAFPLLLALWFTRERWRAPAAVLFSYAALVSFEVVFTGEHYVVDVVGAVTFACAVALLAKFDYAAAWQWSARRISSLGHTLLPPANEQPLEGQHVRG